MSNFQPGFRLSKTDMVVLVIGSLVALYLLQHHIYASITVVFVVGHFFLFCNVFRFSRPPELTWATTFVMSYIASIKFDLLSIPAVFLLQALITIVLVLFELKKPSYHGAGWKVFNPDLERWFEENHSE